MIIKHGIENGKLYTVIDDGKISWLEVINPTDEEIRYLIEKYNLPDDYLLDVKDPYEVSRVEGLEDENPNLFVLSYPIKLNENSFDTRVVSMIVIDDLVITVRNEDSKVFSILRNSDFSRMEENGNIENFVIEVAFIISKVFIDDIKILNNNIDSIEKGIKKTSKPNSLYDMIDIQKSLINFQIGIKENNPVLKSIFDLEYLSESKFRDDLLHDLMVENKQASIMIEKSSIIVENLSDLYSNVISNNLNDVMKVLTSITIVMTVPTIIGGLWGMNVDLPIDYHPFAFWHLLLLTAVISIIIVIILKRKDYL